jgi:hypothetical protein
MTQFFPAEPNTKYRLNTAFGAQRHNSGLAGEADLRAEPAAARAEKSSSGEARRRFGAQRQTKKTSTSGSAVLIFFFCRFAPDRLKV